MLCSCVDTTLETVANNKTRPFLSATPLKVKRQELDQREAEGTVKKDRSDGPLKVQAKRVKSQDVS